MIGEITITRSNPRTRDGNPVKIWFQDDHHVYGAYWSEADRLQGDHRWILVTWPKDSPFYNGRCESSLDLLWDIEVTT